MTNPDDDGTDDVGTDDVGTDAASTYAAGQAMRRAVLGDAHVDRSMAEADDFTRDFQDFITRYAWGAVWTRDGLGRRERSLVTLALLAGLGRAEELPLHVRGALSNGVSRDEIKEVLLHTAVYAGVPAGNTAFTVARRTLDQIDAVDTGGTGGTGATSDAVDTGAAGDGSADVRD